ncbi:MAG: ribonuclease HIII [Bacilli bacterium]|nr:ribonuclease HIII [Bacilli bacterium]
MISLKVSPSKEVDIMEYYQEYWQPHEGEYVLFLAVKDGVTITGYKSSKTYRKVTFQGDKELEEAKLWDEELTDTPTPKKETTKKGWVDLDDQIGSDEVGVGDFLLPMVVVAAYVQKKDIQRLKSLGVNDSKKLSDEKIRELAKELIAFVEYSKLTLPNDKFNEMMLKHENLNSLKAKMHNRALHNLVEKHPETVGIYVDEFCSKELFYKYLNDEGEPQVKDISFRTKGESLFPSVAVASIIARYSFLLEVEKLNKKYGMKFPLGTNEEVKKFARKFIAKYGLEEFSKIAKQSFKTYEEVTKINLID